MKNILVTGAKGFVGKNLISMLQQNDSYKIYPIDIESTSEELEEAVIQADFVYHLAGVNRPKDPSEFMEGNFGFTSVLLALLEKHQSKAPILITSSIQAELDNPYGQSKKAGEDLIFAYGKKNNVTTYVYRLTNLFGKWSKPNYNTVIATFCHNIARGESITVNDPNVVLQLNYIDDVVEAFIQAMDNEIAKEGDFCVVPTVYSVSLGRIAELIQSFKEQRSNLIVPDMSDPFVKKLYSTYLYFLPEDDFSYPLTTHADQRGSFTEIIKSPEAGQVSVNISKPGITKGNHWHMTKNEKFLVVSGTGVIRFREIHSEEVIEYAVSGDKLEVVDIPVGYTHSIVNTGETDMVTIMWVNEMFDPNQPDTYFLEV
ncbi:capsular polysaccharide biosynthesis protein CapF [Fundicoccus culcitae]|uniref:Capsular polysaccharide biosynthesis protein CapF n=1 Tax=Fundicoccus culcitae TaxID=2969821 RepID=A0ABY5P921_9LACT|nr:capsular polysaccharide biosynthesis protein CapF [Fundicoccus culcitae]UUX35244.1 capsular polysaccharide biosynthesis protein CapF [Fundicoccus culcitae]